MGGGISALSLCIIPYARGEMEMEKVKPRTLSGFMELLPEKQVLFDKMTDKLREVYALYGFTPWTRR